MVPEEAVSPKPRNLSFEQAAAIGVPFITAWCAVVDAAQLDAGETILIIGATGAVGQAATKLPAGERHACSPPVAPPILFPALLL